MQKTFKQFLTVTVLMVAGILLINAFAPIASALTVISPEDNPVKDISGQTGSLRQLVLTIVNFFLGFLGLLAVIMIIYGGFLYVSSAGKEESVGTAKKILLYALIGIVIIVISFALVNTLLGGLGGGTDVGVT